MKTARFVLPLAEPSWHEGIPLCDEGCPSYDGKRCELLGYQSATICTPLVRVMGAEPEDNDPCRACGSLSFLFFGRRVRRALIDIGQERKQQDNKWGDTMHRPEIYLAILGEEFGELSTAILSEAMGGRGNIREELVQVAAVAVRMIELCDREVKGWKQ